MKAKSFTLVELLMALVLSSIILYFGILLYESTVSALYGIKERVAVDQEREQLLFHISTDIDESMWLVLEGKEILIIKDSVKVVYEFSNDEVRRYSEDIDDIFHVNVNEVALKYVDFAGLNMPSYLAVDMGKEKKLVRFDIRYCIENLLNWDVKLE